MTLHLRRRIIVPASSAAILLSAGGTAAYAATSSPAATAGCPAVTYAPGIYTYTGNGICTPVQFSGQPSADPPKITTNPIIDAGGHRVNYGIISVGQGPIPAGYGSYAGQDYAGWYWTKQQAELAWAPVYNYDDNGVTSVIRNVLVHYQTTSELIDIPDSPGAYASSCMSFVIPKTGDTLWLSLVNYRWVPVKEC